MAYLSLAAVFLLLCASVVLRLLHWGHWHTATLPSAGIFIIVMASVIKCGADLTDENSDPERRLLSVAGFAPVVLFLLSFYVPVSWSWWLLSLAAVTLLVAGSAAFIAGRKLRQA